LACIPSPTSSRKDRLVRLPGANVGLESLVSGGLKPSADPSNKWLGVSASSSSASKETKVSEIKIK